DGVVLNLLGVLIAKNQLGLLLILYWVGSWLPLLAQPCHLIPEAVDFSLLTFVILIVRVIVLGSRLVRGVVRLGIRRIVPAGVAPAPPRIARPAPEPRKSAKAAEAAEPVAMKSVTKAVPVKSVTEAGSVKTVAEAVTLKSAREAAAEARSAEFAAAHRPAMAAANRSTRRHSGVPAKTAAAGPL